MNVYNIIWADDELNDFLKKGTPLDKTVSLTLGDDEFIIHKAYKATDVEELLLQNKAGFFDAVITDANYNESKTIILDNQDNSGLAYIIGLIQKKKKNLVLTCPIICSQVARKLRLWGRLGVVSVSAASL